MFRILYMSPANYDRKHLKLDWKTPGFFLPNEWEPHMHQIFDVINNDSDI